MKIWIKSLVISNQLINQDVNINSDCLKLCTYNKIIEGAFRLIVTTYNMFLIIQVITMNFNFNLSSTFEVLYFYLRFWASQTFLLTNESIFPFKGCYSKTVKIELDSMYYDLDTKYFKYFIWKSIIYYIVIRNIKS